MYARSNLMSDEEFGQPPEEETRILEQACSRIEILLADACLGIETCSISEVINIADRIAAIPSKVTLELVEPLAQIEHRSVAQKQLLDGVRHLLIRHLIMVLHDLSRNDSTNTLDQRARFLFIIERCYPGYHDWGNPYNYDKFDAQVLDRLTTLLKEADEIVPVEKKHVPDLPVLAERLQPEVNEDVRSMLTGWEHLDGSGLVQKAREIVRYLIDTADRITGRQTRDRVPDDRIEEALWSEQKVDWGSGTHNAAAHCIGEALVPIFGDLSNAEEGTKALFLLSSSLPPSVDLLKNCPGLARIVRRLSIQCSSTEAVSMTRSLAWDKSRSDHRERLASRREKWDRYVISNGSIAEATIDLLESYSRQDLVPEHLTNICSELRQLFAHITWGQLLEDARQHESYEQIMRSNRFLSAEASNLSAAEAYIDLFSLSDRSIAETLPELFIHQKDHKEFVSLIQFFRATNPFAGLELWYQDVMDSQDAAEMARGAFIMFNTENPFLFIHPDILMVIQEVFEHHGLWSALDEQARVKVQRSLNEIFFAASTQTHNDWGYASDACSGFVQALGSTIPVRDSTVSHLLVQDIARFCEHDRWVMPPQAFQWELELRKLYPALKDGTYSELLQQFYAEHPEGLFGYFQRVNIVITAETRAFEIRNLIREFEETEIINPETGERKETFLVICSGPPSTYELAIAKLKLEGITLITIDQHDLAALDAIVLNLQNELTPGDHSISTNKGGISGVNLRHIQGRLPEIFSSLLTPGAINWPDVAAVIDQRGGLLYLPAAQQIKYLQWLMERGLANDESALHLSRGLAGNLLISMEYFFGAQYDPDLICHWNTDFLESSIRENSLWINSVSLYSINELLTGTRDSIPEFDQGHVTLASVSILRGLQRAMQSYKPGYLDADASITPLMENYIGDMDEAISSIQADHPDFDTGKVEPYIAGMICSSYYADSHGFPSFPDTRCDLSSAERGMLMYVKDNIGQICREIIPSFLADAGITNELQAINMLACVRPGRIVDYLRKSIAEQRPYQQQE